MHIKKIKAKLGSFSKLMKIVESNKNITLINILKLSKQISFFYERAIQSKEIIETVLSTNNINNPIVNGSISSFNLFKNGKLDKTKTIWIYVTEEEKYSTNSYFRYEQSLIEKVQKDDVFISIGQRAIKFSQENKYKVIFEHESNEISYLVKVLPEFLSQYLNTNGFHKVRFILNSNKIKKSYLNVLPISKMDFNLNVHKFEIEKKLNIKKMSIFPDVHSFVDSELSLYLTYIIYTLLNESSLNVEKYKLVAQNQKINDLEKKYKQMNLFMLRGKRELEVEQLSLLSTKKDLLHEVKKPEREMNE